MLADRTPAEQNPATIYLASLAEGSRRTMREALNTIATLLGVDETRNVADQDVRCLTAPWGQLHYAHTVAIRSALAEKYAPATANKLLAALRRVLKKAFRLGQRGAEEYQRAILVPTVRGKRESKGRMITDSEIRVLMQICSVDPTPRSLPCCGEPAFDVQRWARSTWPITSHRPEQLSFEPARGIRIGVSTRHQEREQHVMPGWRCAGSGGWRGPFHTTRHAPHLAL